MQTDRQTDTQRHKHVLPSDTTYSLTQGRGSSGIQRTKRTCPQLYLHSLPLSLHPCCLRMRLNPLPSCYTRDEKNNIKKKERSGKSHTHILSQLDDKEIKKTKARRETSHRHSFLSSSRSPSNCTTRVALQRLISFLYISDCFCPPAYFSSE